MRATFTVAAYPDDVFEGTVAQVGSAASPGAGGSAPHRVTLDVANDTLQLRPGMAASVRIATAVHADVLLAPAGALRFRAQPGRTEVYRIAAGGAPARVDVRIGITDGRWIEIVDGVREHDRVVLGTR